MSDCYKCPLRTMTCHSSCPTYGREWQNNVKEYKRRKTELDAKTIVYDGIEKQMKGLK